MVWCKSKQKTAAAKWNQIRKDLRKACRSAGMTVVRTKSAAVRAGFLPPLSSEVPPHPPIDHNRNPGGVRLKAAHVVCRCCSRPPSEVAWRRDGAGRICKQSAAVRRKENRKARALKAKMAAEATVRSN